jgi:hypothetical protein
MHEESRTGATRPAPARSGSLRACSPSSLHSPPAWRSGRRLLGWQPDAPHLARDGDHLLLADGPCSGVCAWPSDAGGSIAAGLDHRSVRHHRLPGAGQRRDGHRRTDLEPWCRRAHRARTQIRCAPPGYFGSHANMLPTRLPGTNDHTHAWRGIEALGSLGRCSPILYSRSLPSTAIEPLLIRVSLVRIQRGPLLLSTPCSTPAHAPARPSGLLPTRCRHDARVAKGSRR